MTGFYSCHKTDKKFLGVYMVLGDAVAKLETFVWILNHIVNLLTFMLRSLKAERCDFGGKNCPGAETLSKQGFLPCPSIVKNSQRRTPIHSKSLKKPLLRQKDDYTPQVR